MKAKDFLKYEIERRGKGNCCQKKKKTSLKNTEKCLKKKKKKVKKKRMKFKKRSWRGEWNEYFFLNEKS